MILLTSNGLSSPALMEALRDAGHAAPAGRIAPAGHVALVVTADHEYKAQNYHVPRLTAELTALGYEVTCFDFDTQTPDDLMAYDAAEMIGGNPYYLLDAIRRRGFEEVLRHFGEEKCLIGCSAGALVLTPSLEIIDLYSPEMNFPGLTDLTALHLTDVRLLPHYSRFLTRYEAFEERCAAYEREHACRVTRINDGEGVLIADGRVQVIRHD